MPEFVSKKNVSKRKPAARGADLPQFARVPVGGLLYLLDWLRLENCWASVSRAGSDQKVLSAGNFDRLFCRNWADRGAGAFSIKTGAVVRCRRAWIRRSTVPLEVPKTCSLRGEATPTGLSFKDFGLRLSFGFSEDKPPRSSVRQMVAQRIALDGTGNGQMTQRGRCGALY